MSDPLYVGRDNPLEPVDRDGKIANRAGAVLPERTIDADHRPLVEDEEADLATPVAPYNYGNRYYAPSPGREHLSGMFANQADAQHAVSQLEALGVRRADVSLIYKDNSGTLGSEQIVTENVGTHASEGAGAGSVIGGIAGAILGALAATATSIVIPGVGLLLAGPIAGALAGAGAGGITGGILGALVGAGIPEETARVYESHINDGGIVIVADVPANVAPQARAILNGATF